MFFMKKPLSYMQVKHLNATEKNKLAPRRTQYLNVKQWNEFCTTIIYFCYTMFVVCSKIALNDNYFNYLESFAQYINYLIYITSDM